MPSAPSRICSILCLLFALAAPVTTYALEGGNRVVALVIEDLLPDLQSELDIWKADLQAEGYDPIINTWPRSQTETRDDNRDTIALWEQIKQLDAEADLHGVILVGRFPHPRWEVHGKYYDRADEAYMHLGDTFEPYTSSMAPLHWVSRVDALDGKGRELAIGGEADLIARYFRHLHAWRTGALRLPHQAVTATTSEFNINLYGPPDIELEAPLPRAEVWEIYCTRIWPDYIFTGKNANNGLPDGGEYFMELSHGYKSGTGTQVHGMDFFHGQPCQFHFVVNGSCHVNGLGNMDSQSLFGRDSGVLWAGSSDFAYRLVCREAIAEGLPVGRIILERHPDWPYSAHQYGDLTVRIKANPDNRLPTVTTAASDVTTVAIGEEVTVAIAGSDPDDAVTRIHLHPKGWLAGKTTRISAAPGETLTVSYDRPHVYTPFALVEDSYRTFGWERMDSIVVTPPDDQPLRVNCGYWPGTDETADRTDPDQADLVDSDGALWFHDQWHVAGTYGRSGDNRNTNEDYDISGTEDDDLYRHCLQLRGGKPVSYHFPLAPGNYTVYVLAADLESKEAGTRLFDLAINGAAVAEAIDVYAEAGDRRVAWQDSWSVAHGDGDLVVQMQRSEGSSKDPYVGAIAVIPEDASASRSIRITVVDGDATVLPCTVSCGGVDQDIDAQAPQASFGDLDPQAQALIGFLVNPEGIAWVDVAPSPLRSPLPMRR